MARTFGSRVAFIGGLLLAPLMAQAPAPSTGPVYAHVGTVPSIIGGRALDTFAFDAKANRLYAGSGNGLYWVNVDEPRPVWKGPMFKAFLAHIEFASELRRIFFISREDVGYVDVDALEQPHVFAHVRASDLAYEPERREVYVAYRAPRLLVFSAESGERSGTIDLPGWWGQSLEAIPGRVFLMLPNRSGLYAVNAASHHVGPWPVDGRILTPAYLEADPSGKYLFLSYYQNIVAIDAATAKVVGRVTTPVTPAIAFDPGAGLLIATWFRDPPTLRMTAYRVGDSGFALVADMKNPSTGGSGIEPTSRGFVQSGVYSFLLWTLQ